LPGGTVKRSPTARFARSRATFSRSTNENVAELIVIRALGYVFALAIADAGLGSPPLGRFGSERPGARHASEPNSLRRIRLDGPRMATCVRAGFSQERRAKPGP
jgi:hypothetical protein